MYGVIPLCLSPVSASSCWRMSGPAPRALMIVTYATAGRSVASHASTRPASRFKMTPNGSSARKFCLQRADAPSKA